LVQCLSNPGRGVKDCGRPIIRTRPDNTQIPDLTRLRRGPRRSAILPRKGNITVHKGECFCGAVRVEVTGEPAAMGYCHCNSCRSWSAAPVNAFTLWKPEAVKVTAGAEHLATFQKTPRSERQYCAKCGGHLMTNHPYLGLVDVYAATLPTLKFSPAVHVNYAETVLPMRDGLPKFKDFPAEFGGSGETIPD
jgi:hypothetical protein